MEKKKVTEQKTVVATGEKDKLKTCCENIITNSTQKSLNWAVNYAKQGLALINESVSLRVLHIQALYILNNISYWRGDVAAQTRSDLKAFIKQTKNEK